MTGKKQPRRRRLAGHMAYYWPHAGMAVAGVLTVVGIVTGESKLFAGSANIAVICTVFIGQRKRNGNDA